MRAYIGAGHPKYLGYNPTIYFNGVLNKLFRWELDRWVEIDTLPACAS